MGMCARGGGMRGLGLAGRIKCDWGQEHVHL